MNPAAGLSHHHFSRKVLFVKDCQTTSTGALISLVSILCGIFLLGVEVTYVFYKLA